MCVCVCVCQRSLHADYYLESDVNSILTEHDENKNIRWKAVPFRFVSFR
jgi:hypothetical protein